MKIIFTWSRMDYLNGKPPIPRPGSRRPYRCSSIHQMRVTCVPDHITPYSPHRPSKTMETLSLKQEPRSPRNAANRRHYSESIGSYDSNTTTSTTISRKPARGITIRKVPEARDDDERLRNSRVYRRT